MKKMIAKICVLLCAILPVVVLAACNGSGYAPTGENASMSGTSETVKYEELLAIQEYYFPRGDTDSIGYVFFSDGSIIIEDDLADRGDGSVERGEYTVVDDTITVYRDDKAIAIFTIVDERTIVHTETGIEYTCGELVYVEDDILWADCDELFDNKPVIISGLGFGYVYYHLDGKEDSGENIQFNDDTYIQFNRALDIHSYEYEIVGNSIIVTDDGEYYTSLEILDLCTLRNENGDIYALTDSEGQELVTSAMYYLYPDFGSESLFFWDHGEVRHETVDGEVMGSFEISNDVISIEFENGASMELVIINKRILELDDWATFVRMF